MAIPKDSIPDVVEAAEARLDAAKLKERQQRIQGSAKHAGGHKKGRKSQGKEKGKGKPMAKSQSKRAPVEIPTATTETLPPAVSASEQKIVPPSAAPVIATAPKKFQEETKMTGLNQLGKLPIGRIQGQFTLRSITPRVQAVFDRLAKDIQPDTLPVGITVHKLRNGKTVLTIRTENNGDAIVPASLNIVPNSWNLSLGAEKRENETTTVCYRNDNGEVKVQGPYFTLMRKEGQLPVALFGFCSTLGNSRYGYVAQVNKDREVLITKWSLRVIDKQRANRDRGEVVLHERLPLHNVEKTKAAIPILLVGFSEALCKLFGDLTTAAPATTPAAPATEPTTIPA